MKFESARAGRRGWSAYRMCTGVMHRATANEGRGYVVEKLGAGTCKQIVMNLCSTTDYTWQAEATRDEFCLVFLLAEAETLRD